MMIMIFSMLNLKTFIMFILNLMNSLTLLVSKKRIISIIHLLEKNKSKKVLDILKKKNLFKSQLKK